MRFNTHLMNGTDSDALFRGNADPGNAPSVQEIDLTRGNDIFTTYSKEDADVHGLGGDDYLYAGGPANYILNGDGGNDSLIFTGTGTAHLIGGQGFDVLSASGPGSAVMDGGAGTDSFIWYGGSGSVTMNGGSGIDEYNLNAGGGNVTITHLQKGEHIDVWGAGDVTFVQENDHSFLMVNPDGTVGCVTMDGHHPHMFTDGTVVAHPEGMGW